MHLGNAKKEGSEIRAFFLGIHIAYRLPLAAIAAGRGTVGVGRAIGRVAVAGR